MSNNRQRTLVNGGVQHALDYLKRMQAENPAFFYAVHTTDDTNDPSIATLFWADANSKNNYNYFGDTVIFDSSYKTNRSMVPFVSFTGLNHHKQPVLFGCALVFHESESSFIWLFQTWIHTMSGQGHHPVSITTDPDNLIQVAVSQVLPETRHRFRKSGIFLEVQEKLNHVYQSNPTFEIEFHKCVNETETIEEFESCWETLLENYRYVIMDNEWLQSMYNARQQWIPAYTRDTFFGEIIISDTTLSNSSFFDGYVTLTTATTIPTLLKQYEKAVSGWYEKELKADHDSKNTAPVLKTPSPMEKEAASLYTNTIFIKFQEELVETLANPATKIDDESSETVITYRVAKFGEEERAHIVRFNPFEMKAICSCQMFEFSGIICRHILAVFRAKNVLTLPSQYILKRWTKNAKSGAIFGQQQQQQRASPSSSELLLQSNSNNRESFTVRFNNLRQEAIKYVEEGAKSIHIYNVAMDALQEANRKVTTLKNGSLDNNSGHRDMPPSGEENHTTPCQSSEEKEKKIRELTAELENTKQRSEVYRSNLLAVLKDMEDQKLKLAVKVQNAKLSLKD